MNKLTFEASTTDSCEPLKQGMDISCASKEDMLTGTVESITWWPLAAFSNEHYIQQGVFHNRTVNLLDSVDEIWMHHIRSRKRGARKRRVSDSPSCVQQGGYGSHQKLAAKPYSISRLPTWRSEKVETQYYWPQTEQNCRSHRSSFNAWYQQSHS